MSRRFLFVLGSARAEGNTELLARRAAEQLPADVEQRWIHLAEQPLPDFVDLRHDSEYVRPPSDTATGRLLDATLAATDAGRAARPLPAPDRVGPRAAPGTVTGGYALMSFAANRAQAAEPNTAAYRTWSSRFFVRSSQ